MRMHIGVNETFGLIHSIDMNAANLHDIVPAVNLIHGDEKRVFGDSGCLGIQKRNVHNNRINVLWFIAKRTGTQKKLDDRKPKAKKLKICAQTEAGLPFRCIKQVFSNSKVRYRGPTRPKQ